MVDSIFSAHNYTFNFYGIPPMLSSLVLLIVGLIVFVRKRFSISSAALFLLIVTVSFWLFSYAWLYWAINYATALQWANLAYLTVPLTSACIYIFTVIVLSKFVQRIAITALAITLGIFFVFMQLNKQSIFHELNHFWWGYYPKYHLFFSIIFLIYFFSYMLASLVEFAIEYRHAQIGSFKYQKIRLLMLGILIAYLGSVDYLANYTITFYPFGYIPIMIFLLIISYVIIRYELVDLTPSFATNQILNTMADPLIVCDIEGIIRVINLAMIKIFGYKEHELLGKPVNFLVSHDSNERGIDLFNLIRNNALTTNDEILFRSQDDLPIFVNISYSQLCVSSHKHPDGWVIIARDIRERKKAESQLNYLADHDHLTGLLNRRSFENELVRQIAYAKNSFQVGALLWLDIDHFKDINDTFGHHIGDQILLNIVGIIKRQLRKSDIVARLGGDEFAIILPDINQQTAENLVFKIVDAVAKAKIHINSHDFRVTISMGVTLFPSHDDLAENLSTYADLAMYKAKQNGRNTYCFYSSDKNWQPPFKSHLTWATRIKNALSENKLVLYAQPIVDLKSGSIKFYETLLRMQDEDESLIPPAVFLEVAERYGLMNEINHWVVKQVLSILSQNKDIILTCNVSSNALSDSLLFNLIKDAVAINSFNPNHLILEITENAVISDIEHSLKFISDIKDFGIKFALDDFGTGMSSFSHLKYFNVNFLKIDGSFIKSLATNKLDQELVHAIIDIAKILGIETIAEYVETEEMAQILIKLGADYGQGFFYGKLQPVTELT